MSRTRGDRPDRARYTASASLGRAALEASQAYGVDGRDLLRQAGIPPDVLAKPDGRIEVRALLRLWELAAASVPDPFFGLHAGERAVASRLTHVVGYVMRNGHTLGDCFRIGKQFSRVVNEGSDPSLRVDHGTAIFRIGPRAGQPAWPRSYAEMCMVAFLSAGRTWSGVDIQALRVTFQHAAPRRLDEYRRIFGPTVEFGAAKNELHVRADVLDLPVRGADQEVRTYLEDRATDLLRSLGGAERLTDRVLIELRSAFDGGPPTVETIAKRLAVSSRTLQRRLADEDTQFASLVDEVRRDLALRLLSERGRTITEVASLLGYRHPASFRIAFMRWTGRPPRAYRRERAS